MRALKSPWRRCCFLLCLAFGLPIALARQDGETPMAEQDPSQKSLIDDVSFAPRLWPAAKAERYDAQTDRIRTLHPESLSWNVQLLPMIAHGAWKDQDREKANKVMDAATKRFKEFLHQLPDYPEDYPVNPQHQQEIPVQTIQLLVKAKNSTMAGGTTSTSRKTRQSPFVGIASLEHGFDESYGIQVDHDGDILVEANTVFGIVRGLESLAQLLEFAWLDPDHHQPVFLVRNVPLWISDRPSFPYRGLMIDTSRHYLPLHLILDNLNVMAMNKLNILHWHVTDSQSWPYQSTTFPELSEKGAYSKHEIYTARDVQRVLDEAYLLGIRVIPEFDLPGHSEVIGHSHPELMARCGNEWQGPTLDPTKPEVYTFVEQLYHEITALFPDSYIHIGGDEVNLDCWKKSETIRKWAHAHKDMTANEILNYFESILTDIVADLGKIPIAWQELLNEGVELSAGTVIDVWKGVDRKTMEEATKRNYPMILSGCWYLDHTGDKWYTYYDCDPLDFNGTIAQKNLVMGGHASMWGEMVDATNFMKRVWPRASAMAESLWSGKRPMAYNTTLKATSSARLAKFRCFMVLRGVDAQPIGPGSCPHEYIPPTHQQHFSASTLR